MGVPKFFRYISERYPNLSELVGSAELPQFDNMYLDMNGIIHVCSHPDDSNVHFRMSEEQMFHDILHYIETLFQMIQPQKLFFMAVDGVAPRAKMNQQRGRRFQSAKTANDLIEKAKQKGEKLPEESRFDSNCITPGTVFMVRLQEALKHFVKVKLSKDPSWRHCRFVLSGHETPGEGEHKIMEYIRYLKTQPDYDPNTRHCLCGLDADLIMLGLCTHELNFSLLREEVKFDKKAKRTPSVDETRFYLLHLCLLREYLELEFVGLKQSLKFEYDLERIIDDWIFMCFMVGNDFIPNLPNLHINSNALPILYKMYKIALPKLDGYINEGGKLNLARLEVFMEALSEVDRDLFRENYEDLKLLETKYDNDETFGVDLTELTAETRSDLEALVKNTMLDFGSPESSSDENDSNDGFLFGDLSGDESVEGGGVDGDDEDEDLDVDKLFEKEFRLHKRDYYINKMKYPEMTSKVLAEQTECYITALQWTLSYYYRGVCSWGWFYPHHYAPYISDIKNFKHLNIKFALGRPFLPFQQLLSVLPAASKELLPAAYHRLMTHPSSKIIEYYPLDFETDLNGKKQEWEALVLIPFINETKLINAMDECNDDLSESERMRNIHSPMLQYDYCAQDQGSLSAEYGQPMIAHVFCKETQVNRSDVQVPEEKLVLGPCKGASKNVYFPGFPTMRHLKHSATLKAQRIKVFQQQSRNESMIIRIDETKPEVDIETLAKLYINKEIYIGWPHLREAKVIGVSDMYTRVDKFGIERFERGNREFMLQVKQITDHNLLRLGIDLGEINQLLYVTPLLNREYLNTNDGKLTLTKNWSKISLAVAPKAVVEDIAVYQKSLQQFIRVEDVFTRDSTVFMMNSANYGCQGTVIDPAIRKGRLKISIIAHPQPDFSKAKQIHRKDANRYMNSYTAASAIGMNNRLFNRITGTVLVVTGEKRFPISDNDNKLNIGLQLKFPKHNEEVPNYTRYENNQWLYSQAAVDLVESYSMKFPELFELLNQKTGLNDLIFESELNASRKEGEESRLKEITRWVKEQPHSSIGRQPCGTNSLDTNTIEAIVAAIDQLKNEPVRCIKLQIKPHLLYKPNLNDITVAPDPSATYEIFDRVVIARDQYTVPLGARGTIISMQPVMEANPVRQENINVVDYIIEVLFDEPFEKGTSIPDVAEKRIFKLRKSVLINISHGLGLNRQEQQQLASNPEEKSWQTKESNKIATNMPPEQSWRIRDNKDNHLIEQHLSKDIKNWPSLNGTNTNGNRKQNNLPNPITKPIELWRSFKLDVVNDKNASETPTKVMVAKKRDEREANRNISVNLQSKPTPSKNNVNINLNSNNLVNIPLPKQFNELSLAGEEIFFARQNETKVSINDPSIVHASMSKKDNNNDDNCDNGSDALKMLLGIAGAKAPHLPQNQQKFMEMPQRPLNNESQPIDLNSLFGKAPPGTALGIAPDANSLNQINIATLLPKPPSNWHTAAKEKSNFKQSKTVPTTKNGSSNIGQHPMAKQPLMNQPPPVSNMPPFYQLFQPPPPPQHLNYPNIIAPPSHQSQPLMMNPRPNHPPFSNNNMGNVPVPARHAPFIQSNQNIRMSGPPIAANFAYGMQHNLPPPHQQMSPKHTNRQGPNGPQNLSNNSKHLPGHGAFIPLQAIRKSSKPKPNSELQLQQQLQQQTQKQSQLQPKLNAVQGAIQKSDKHSQSEIESQINAVKEKLAKETLKKAAELELKKSQKQKQPIPKPVKNAPPPSESKETKKPPPPKRIAANFNIKPV